MICSFLHDLWHKDKRGHLDGLLRCRNRSGDQQGNGSRGYREHRGGDNHHYIPRKSARSLADGAAAKSQTRYDLETCGAPRKNGHTRARGVRGARRAAARALAQPNEFPRAFFSQPIAGVIYKFT